MIDRSGLPDIILTWPVGREPDAVAVPGHSVRTLPKEHDAWWIDIHRAAVPIWSREDLMRWLARYRGLALEDGVLVALDDATGLPVATAGSIVDERDGLLPGGAQLAWVATVPKHQKRGLAAWMCALATGRLVREGHRRVYVCTGDDLKVAIRVYLRLGYVPWLYASDQHDRWARICAAIDHPFTPDRWRNPFDRLGS